MDITKLPEEHRLTAVQMAKLYLLVGEKASDEHAIEELVENINRGVVLPYGDSIFHTYNAGPQCPLWSCPEWKRLLKDDRDLDMQGVAG